MGEVSPYTGPAQGLQSCSKQLASGLGQPGDSVRYPGSTMWVEKPWGQRILTSPGSAPVDLLCFTSLVGITAASPVWLCSSLPPPWHGGALHSEVCSDENKPLRHPPCSPTSAVGFSNPITKQLTITSCQKLWASLKKLRQWVTN